MLFSSCSCIRLLVLSWLSLSIVGLPNVLGELMHSLLYKEISSAEIFTQDMVLANGKSYIHPTVTVESNTLIELGTFEEIMRPIVKDIGAALHHLERNG